MDCDVTSLKRGRIPIVKPGWLGSWHGFLLPFDVVVNVIKEVMTWGRARRSSLGNVVDRGLVGCDNYGARFYASKMVFDAVSFGATNLKDAFKLSNLVMACQRQGKISQQDEMPSKCNSSL
ncbi:hypothetical protein Tco_0609380 [Tanacetum coccineum]